MSDQIKSNEVETLRSPHAPARLQSIPVQPSSLSTKAAVPVRYSPPSLKRKFILSPENPVVRVDRIRSGLGFMGGFPFNAIHGEPVDSEHDMLEETPENKEFFLKLPDFKKYRRVLLAPDVGERNDVNQKLVFIDGSKIIVENNGKVPYIILAYLIGGFLEIRMELLPIQALKEDMLVKDIFGLRV